MLGKKSKSKTTTPQPPGPEGILLPLNLVESLLVAVSMGDRTAISNVAATIREVAEAQAPETFK